MFAACDENRDVEMVKFELQQEKGTGTNKDRTIEIIL